MAQAALAAALMGPFFEPRPAGREREAADARRRRLREDALKTWRRTLRDAGRNRRGPCRSRSWTTERSNRSRRARGASSRPHHWNRRPWRARRRSMRRLCLRARFSSSALETRGARRDGVAAPQYARREVGGGGGHSCGAVSRSAPGRASRGGIHNSFGGSGGLLVRHGDWCCCWFAVSLRARANLCRLREERRQRTRRPRRGGRCGHPWPSVLQFPARTPFFAVQDAVARS